MGGEERCKQGFRGGDSRERNHLVEPGVDGKVILRWIFMKWDVLLIWLRIGTCGGHV